MNKINTYISTFILIFVCIVAANANTTVFSVNDRFSDQEIETQIRQLSNDIDLIYNDEIKTIINTYISSGRKNTELILSRSQYYFPLMERIIEENNLPEELKFLSVIESGLRPSVKSRVGAVGLWQFMSGTAKEYDLKINSTVDDRKDVKKSTEAALKYLSDLYKRYDDWTLALAAYNCGPGNINKAIRKAGGSKDFWEIRKYLPKETRRYLPKLVATMYVMNHFQAYGLSDVSQKFSEYNAFGLAKIYDKTTFSHISDFSGLTVNELKKYNPSYASNFIPASSIGNNLIMPEGYLLTFLQNKQMMSSFKEVFYLKNTIVKNTEIESIAMPIERDVLSSFELNSLDLVELESSEIKIETNIAKAKSIPSFKTARKFRLRKRQSLVSWVQENKIDLSIYKAEVSERGVITLNER